MSDWRRGRLGELATGHRGVTYADGQLCEFQSAATATLLRSNNISRGQLNFDSVQIVPARLVSDKQFLYSGDIAVCMSNGSKALVGKAAPFVKSSSARFTVGAFCSVFRPTESVDPAFVAHIFQSQGYRNNLDLALAGTAINNLRNSDVENFECGIPPIREQTRIAKILDTLDTAIHETEALIAKLKAVKQGLLHDLLTRGIDANGELRPHQAEAPQLYKESALGWIPKEWEAKHLGEILADVDPAMRSGPFGSALLKHELVSAGIPLLGIDNVLTERFSADFRRFVTPRRFSELVRYAVHPDDLMITIMGTIGRCCLVPDGIGLALSSKHTWTISINKSVYSPYLAMLQVNYSPWVLQHFAKGQQGGTMAAIRSETLRSTVLPVPPRDEQSLIEERLREISRRIDLETDSVAKMQVEKSGLMDDLLTGRVRVTPLLNSVDPLVQPPAALIIQQAVGQMGGCDA